MTLAEFIAELTEIAGSVGDDAEVVQYDPEFKETFPPIVCAWIDVATGKWQVRI
jgi:hypothetical protein